MGFRLAKKKGITKHFIIAKKNKMKYLLLLFSITFHGQVLHHQMISTQGQTTKIPNGVTINQTIGQQSLTGNSSNKNYVVMQGFQQSAWGNYIASNTTDAFKGITAITYPNPFTTAVTFEFSKPITDGIDVTIYDVIGRLVYAQKKNVDTTKLTIDLASLPSSEYLVRLSNSNLNYYTKIIKL